MAEVVKHGLLAGSDLLAQIEAGEWTTANDALPGGLGWTDHPPAHPISPPTLLSAMRHDKKRCGGRLHLVLLRDIGDPTVTEAVDRDDLLATLESLNP